VHLLSFSFFFFLFLVQVLQVLLVLLVLLVLQVLLVKGEAQVWIGLGQVAGVLPCV
jgi:hypothetical protein